MDAETTTPVAFLTDGPLAGATVAVELDRTNLPPPFVVLDCPVLDETTEALDWSAVRYGRSPQPIPPAGGGPWRYHHAPPHRSQAP